MPKIMKNNASLHSKEEKPISVANLYKSSEETPTRVESSVIGPIPDWISGNLFRNGPGKFEAGDDKVGHLFDGFALMHKFEIAKGKVFYSSRYLRGEGYTKAMAQNRIVISGFGTSAVPDPCKSIFSRFFSYFQPPPASDNCNVNYMQIGEDFYALTESPRFVKVDPEVLQTEHQHDIRKYVAVHIATAHPHYGNDQTVYNMGSSYGGQSFYNIIKIPPPNPEVELPRINYEQYNGQKYRYFYSLSGDGPKIVKVDTVKKSFKLWEDPSCYPSEPVFVPRPGAEEEDDGVVLSSVIDLKGTGRPPFLVVLDAKTFTELARAETPADVPFGIHGIFIPK